MGSSYAELRIACRLQMTAYGFEIGGYKVATFGSSSTIGILMGLCWDMCSGIDRAHGFAREFSKITHWSHGEPAEIGEFHLR